MSSVKCKKIGTLPLKVKRHIPGLKPEVFKHDLMATTMEHYQDFDDVEPEMGMVNVANRKGEVVSVKVQVDDENEQIDSTAKSSKYSNRKEKDFAAWSEIIRESLTISCEIEGHLMSSAVCCTCKKNVGDVITEFQPQTCSASNNIRFFGSILHSQLEPKSARK